MNVLLFGLLLLSPLQQQPDESQVRALEPTRIDGLSRVYFPDGRLARESTAAIEGARVVGVEGNRARVLVWQEGDVPYYRSSTDGHAWSRVRETSYTIEMQRASFDPLLGAPDFSASLLEDTGGLYFVQLLAPPLGAHRERIERLGGKVRHFVGAHTHLVSMDAAAVVRADASRSCAGSAPTTPSSVWSLICSLG